MRQRLTVLTAVFAVFATASIALAAGAVHRSGPIAGVLSTRGVGPEATPVRIIELPRVVVVARRLPA